MGAWDTFCLICGGPTHSGIYDPKTNKTQYLPEHKWLNNCILITNTNKVIFTNSVTEYGYANTPFGKVNLCPNNNSRYKLNAFVAHTTCYKFLMLQTHKKLSYSEAYPKMSKFQPIYKPIKQEQFFESWVAYSKYPYVLESPFQNKKQSQRLKTICKTIYKK